MDYKSKYLKYKKKYLELKSKSMRQYGGSQSKPIISREIESNNGSNILLIPHTMSDGASFCLKDKFELSEKVLLDIKQVRASWINFFVRLELV